MKRIGLIFLALLLLFCAGCSTKAPVAAKPEAVKTAPAKQEQKQVVQKTTTELTLMKDTPYATPAYVYKASVEGPAVMVVGGVHGNEPAGSLAAQKFCDVDLLKGTLIVIPKANITALAAEVRTLPETGDLNRSYPGKKAGTPAEEITYEIVQLMQQYKVAMVLDLHEGYAFNTEEPKSVGETILPGKDDISTILAIDAMEHVNKQITDPKKKFSVLANPIAGSTAYYANTVLKVPAFTIETSSRQPLEDRVKYSFTIASFLVASQGVIAQ